MRFEQAAVAVQNEQEYAQLQTRIDAAFETRNVEVFLNRVNRARLRVRDFDSVLQSGLMSQEAAALYQSLPVSGQALIRERYLQKVEAVPMELRQRYFRVYAYY